MADAVYDPLSLARKAVDLSADIDQFLGYTAPGDTSRADDERRDLHGLLHCIL